jgi:hypothetical protein
MGQPDTIVLFRCQREFASWVEKRTIGMYSCSVVCDVWAKIGQSSLQGRSVEDELDAIQTNDVVEAERETFKSGRGGLLNQYFDTSTMILSII